MKKTIIIEDKSTPYKIWITVQTDALPPIQKSMDAAALSFVEALIASFALQGLVDSRVILLDTPELPSVKH